jgi:hypothetical protein
MPHTLPELSNCSFDTDEFWFSAYRPFGRDRFCQSVEETVMTRTD